MERIVEIKRRLAEQSFQITGRVSDE